MIASLALQQVLRQATTCHAAVAAAALEGSAGGRLSQPAAGFFRWLSSTSTSAAPAAAPAAGTQASCSCASSPATTSSSHSHPSPPYPHTSHTLHTLHTPHHRTPLASLSSCGHSLSGSLSPCTTSPHPLHPFALHLSRSYAKKAGGGAAGGGGAAAARKRVRRSSTRLFSCRNDRFRSTFEQIWPTLRLTEDEAQLFKRNSRFFVIETGRALSLQSKFDLSRPSAPASASTSAAAAPVALKPHYADARVALFESQLHLDAIGEQPRYLKIRRVRTQFGIRLQNIRKVRLLLGFQRRGYLQRLYELAQVQPGTNKVWKLICTLESRLSMFALRMGLAPDSIEARKVIRNKVHVNGAPPEYTDAYVTQLGDVLSPAPSERPAFQGNLSVAMGSLMYDVHRDHLQF